MKLSDERLEGRASSCKHIGSKTSARVRLIWRFIFQQVHVAVGYFLSVK